MKWRKWNTILHRDVGYIIVGLTIIYGISGIAVNHVQDWNPNYKIDKEFVTIEPIAAMERQQMVEEALKKLNIAEQPKDSFRPDEETLQLFYENKTYSVDVPSGNVMIETTQQRRVLFEMNQLHLNSPKEAWTYIADAYAFSLVFVAITGLFVLKGKNGITGRGAWLTSIGVLFPVVYWFYYLYWS
ncbi:MAG: PepSY-associated TM helix domain-containing protein [Ignavibacteriales bacterium]|nr:PepSY-associated TM helix domain-containing protein [Ignavibacteriales bacterium]